MPEIEETLLPGVGVRHEFATERGERVAVLTRRSGRRELAISDRDDPDRSSVVLHLSADDSRSLGVLLGGNQVSESVGAVQQQVEGLAIEWVTLTAGSAFVGDTIGHGEFRTRTGASIVAVLRDGATIAAPGPDLALAAGDVVVAVSTPDGLEHLRELLRG